jgi:hypothetical protein
MQAVAGVKKQFALLRKRGAIITVQGQIGNEKTPIIGVFLSEIFALRGCILVHKMRIAFRRQLIELPAF